MAVPLDNSGKDDLKTQFATREGEYRLMTLSEYSRPNRVGYQNNQSSPQVRVSIVSLPSPPPPPIGGGGGGGGGGSGGQLAGATSTNSTSNSNNITLPKQQSFSNGLEHQTASGYSTPVGGDRICFNYGKELYVYSYRGAKKVKCATDLNKPIDKKLYKGTSPSCHDFNATAATCEGAPLLVGFSTGQIQLVHPGRREQGKLFNEEVCPANPTNHPPLLSVTATVSFQRNIDKTKVTCLKWIPGSQNQFLVSHASGCIYLYNDELPCTPATPTYQPCMAGDGYVVLASKSKATKNPLYKWCFGQHENASINEFCFSPCGQHLAVVSQDGFLRIFHYEKMELVGIARSYFGGFLCVCWSPDGKYVVVGGEDDLVTVFSLHEQRVVARGQGHRSWVSVVAFDPYTTSYSSALEGDELSDEEVSLSEQRNHHHHGAGYCLPDGTAHPTTKQPGTGPCDKLTAQNRLATCYRLGSVSQDTQICLWDITEDVLRQSDSSSDKESVDSKTVKRSAANAGGDTAETPIVTAVTGSSAAGSGGKMSSGGGKKSKGGSGDSGSGGGGTQQHSSSTFNSITQRLTSLSFGSGGSGTSSTSSGSGSSCDKNDKSGGKSGTAGGGSNSKRSIIALGSKSFSSNSNSNSLNNNHHVLNSSIISNNNQSVSGSPSGGGGMSSAFTSIMTSSLTKSKGSGTGGGAIGSGGFAPCGRIVSSYDPMKLIGTPACPRFDDCPVLEPLICKKIAHERLTALIFREDCFLTACQDGFVYTWARPGFVVSNSSSASILRAAAARPSDF
uniref:Uncharacterized protein n=1 Tax=Anopheles minimus TaxID=112268 RepID=A0A182VYE4_9DIPT